MANYVKFMRGTHAAYKKLTEKDADTIYFLSDKDDQEGSLYLGNKLIAGPDDCIPGARTLGELADVIVSNELNYESILMYDPYGDEGAKWYSYNIDALAFGGAQENFDGKLGFVPAPKKEQREMFLRGDGTWAIMGAYGQIFEIIPTVDQTHEDAIATRTTDVILHTGDIAIIKDYIAPEKYENTSYVYNGTKWCAMDGNYNAENVYFSEDFIFTESIGTIEVPESGSIKVEAAGKNIKQFFNTLFTEEKEPAVIQPYLIIDTPENKPYEVGTKVNPTYTVSYNPGVYEFGPPTEVKVKWWDMSDSNKKDPIDGVFPEVIVEDDTYYEIYAKALLSDGVQPYTNLGKESTTTRKITEAVYSLTSPLKISGYRKSFWGAVDEKTEITSDIIRSLVGSSTFSFVNGSSFTIDLTEKNKRVIIAYPATLRNLTQVLDENDADANIVSGFGDPIIMKVKSANNYDEIDYKVYIMDFAREYGATNKFKVTI